MHKEDDQAPERSMKKLHNTNYSEMDKINLILC